MDAQQSFDLSSLPSDDVETIASPPAKPAKPAVPAQPVVKAKKQARPAPDKLVFTHEMLGDDLNIESLFSEVYENGLVIGVTRKAWNGIRSKQASKRVQGLRVQMRIDGYEIAAKIEAPDGHGRLASAVYAKGDSKLVITYGTEPGYGHTIKAV